MSQTDISKNNIDSSNNIIYPSLFNYTYPNDSSNNHFFLEAITISDIQLWKNSFNYDTSNNIIINYKYLSKLLLDLKKCITNNLHFAGNSFSNKQLVLGNIYLYYVQFISNFIKCLNNLYHLVLMSGKVYVTRFQLNSGKEENIALIIANRLNIPQKIGNNILVKQ